MLDECTTSLAAGVEERGGVCRAHTCPIWVMSAGRVPWPPRQPSTAGGAGDRAGRIWAASDGQLLMAFIEPFIDVAFIDIERGEATGSWTGSLPLPSPNSRLAASFFLSLSLHLPSSRRATSLL